MANQSPPYSPFDHIDWGSITAALGGVASAAGVVFAALRKFKRDTIKREETNLDIVRGVMQDLRDEIKRLKIELAEEREEREKLERAHREQGRELEAVKRRLQFCLDRHGGEQAVFPVLEE